MEDYHPISDQAIKETVRIDGQNKVQSFLNDPTFLTAYIGKPDIKTAERYGVKFLRKMETYSNDEGLNMPEIVSDGDTFFFFLFGLGPGLDIGSILKKFKPTVLVIIEPNLENIYRSLSSDDWQEFVDWQRNEDTMPFLLIDDTVTVTIGSIQKIIRDFSSAQYGNNPYFTFSETDYADAVLEGICNSGMLFGLGFFFDETLMMKNSYLNLEGRDRKIFTRTYEPNVSSPTFVVGAGPSLDADLEFVKKYSDQAIIISTGTAIRSLLMNGITPDFHVELENIHVYSSVVELSKKFDLSSICLLVPTTIDPHIIKFFEHVVYYYRGNLSPHPLLCPKPDHMLCDPAPLVVNASFSLAIDIGALDIFLIGTDFGSRGAGSDHAKDNVLYTENAIVGYIREYDTEIPANFSGHFFASDDFIVGLKTMTNTIFLHAHDRNIYNCSDGARVEGATPIRSAEVQLTGSVKTKTQDIKTIHERFATSTAEQFAERWNDQELRKGINVFCDYALKILGNPNAYSDTLYFSAFLTLTRRAPKHQRSGFHRPIEECVATLFRGTLVMMLAYIRYYLNVDGNQAVKNKLREKIADEMTNVIESMCSDAMEMLDNPTDVPPAKEEGEWNAADFVQEANYTWGKTLRNAECPCGSGKRYKHCHGNDV